ncbi:hypothetical protein Cch01nite_09080 [Cellulomonas chitinilytica]|uniref:DUF2304 domain-containing protein n=1 Tax=Cellulomonas chitinilytica TaxID=398759 RepID=A0A919U1I4_9CELL|nr:DUF2304 domain-containing protein [Cellulomonas chitinilytica]GIG20184.1 hypothetical protein Cch01nite_09080 [Cellulomonas chitinilytica]
MSGYGFAIAASLGIVVFLVVLLRSRRVREKYAFIWIAVGIAVAILAAFPELMLGLTSLVGIQTPSNLLFSASLIVLLFVCIQLSVEVSGLEEETRTLAEEVALLRLDVERAAAAAGNPQPGPDASGPGSDASNR